MKALIGAALCAAFLAGSAWAQDAAPETPAAATEPAPLGAPPEAAAPAGAEAAARAQAEAQAQAFYESLHRQTGLVSLVGGKVQLNVPESHYYIGPEDARRVIVDLWGNPPQAGNVEGMVFQAGVNPANAPWGAVLEYLNDGHVDDSEAATINYDNLLHDLQEQVRTENQARREGGYPELTLNGWAEAPHYAQQTHTLYWAKLLSFTGAGDALNYDIRVLGREGVFVVSFVAAPQDIGAIRAEAPTVMAMPTFTPGNTYNDFQPGIDQQAAYGIGGLIAGGTLAAVAQKTGILALLLGFGKKFIVLIIAFFGAIATFVRRLFGGKKNDDDIDPPAAAPPSDPPPPPPPPAT